VPGLLTPGSPIGTDGAALLPGGARKRIEADGSTVYSFSNGSELVIGAISGTSFTATTLLNGVEEATVTTSYNANTGDLVFTGSKIDGSIVINPSTQGTAPFSALGCTATYSSDSTGSVTGPSLSATLSVAETTSAITASTTLNGYYYSASRQISSSGTDPGCHACPELGVESVNRVHPDAGLPQPVKIWLGAAGLIVAYMGLAIAVVMGPLVAIVVAVIAIVFAIVMFVDALL
jgi:hypothetical protein